MKTLRHVDTEKWRRGEMDMEIPMAMDMETRKRQ
jgi:hypothetical protein